MLQCPQWNLLGPSPLEPAGKCSLASQGNCSCVGVLGEVPCFKPCAGRQAPTSWHHRISPPCSWLTWERPLGCGSWDAGGATSTAGDCLGNSLDPRREASSSGDVSPGASADQDLPADEGKFIKGLSFLLQVRQWGELGADSSLL